MLNLTQTLKEQITTQKLTHAKFVLAYSGGLDSTALLCLFKSLQKELPYIQIRATHIHHGLSRYADNWLKSCQQQCSILSIPFNSYRVTLVAKDGIEADARFARYQAFNENMQKDEILVTAHHQNDHTETFFLALKRGSGVQGLAAMSSLKSLFGIQVFRPLLAITRFQLEEYMTSQQLTWIDDESNFDDNYDRNFLRLNVLPVLNKKWPHFNQMVQRSAFHCDENQQLLTELLTPIITKYYDPNTHTFAIHDFKQFSRLQQAALLRFWLQYENINMPSVKQLNELIDKVIFASNDRNPELQLGSYYIRRYLDKLYLTPFFQDISDWECEISVNQHCQLPDNLGSLAVKEIENDQIEINWLQYKSLGIVEENTINTVLPKPPKEITMKVVFSYRERVRLSPNSANKIMKHIWQKYQIAPWIRQRIPLILYAGKLQAALSVFKITSKS